jgi:hypothetical protein
MDKDTVLSSFGKYIEPLNRLKLQVRSISRTMTSTVKKRTEVDETSASMLAMFYATLVLNNILGKVFLYISY